MASGDSATHQILSLSEQLDAMLLGWLERRAGRHRVELGATAVAILTVGTKHVPEVETFCAKWGLRVERIGGSEVLAALRVSGPALPVIGFSEITAMYRS
jgi:hypothetical protein